MRKLDNDMQKAIADAIKAKTESANAQMREMEIAMAGMRDRIREMENTIETLNDRHTLVMEIIADKTNTIRMLNGRVSQLADEAKHFRLEAARFEKSRDYWRDRSHVFARKFRKVFSRYSDFENWLGLTYRSDTFDYSNVIDYSTYGITD